MLNTGYCIRKKYYYITDVKHTYYIVPETCVYVCAAITRTRVRTPPPPSI